MDEVIALRPINESDTQAIVRWRNSDAVKENLFDRAAITEAQHHSWISTVYDIDWEQKTAEVGRTVVDKNVCAEKGIGTEATTAVCLFAFDVLKIKKIIGVVLKSNERIIKVDTRAGFVITGDHDSESYAIEMTRESINLG